MTVSCAPAPSATDSGADSHRPVGEVAPPARSARYHSLDFWRGVACLLVIVYHSTFYAATPKLLAGVRAGAMGENDAVLSTGGTVKVAAHRRIAVPQEGLVYTPIEHCVPQTIVPDTEERA